jgi:hypothetical protein
LFFGFGNIFSIYYTILAFPAFSFHALEALLTDCTPSLLIPVYSFLHVDLVFCII